MTARTEDPSFLLGVGVFSAALLILLVRLGRAAFWLDESTTAMIVHRSWRDLARVIWRIDAPLGPYYLLMKPWSAISPAEWWVRLPSAVPMALAAGLLARWAAQRWGTTTGIVSGAVMMVLPSFTRFGQEVRPYGLMVLAVVASTLAWWRWQERGGRGAAAWYAVSVGVLPLLHLLALTMVVVHLVTGFVTGGCRRWQLVGRTVGLAVLGLLPGIPFTVLAEIRAVGVAHPLKLTAAHWWTTFIGIFGDQASTPLSQRTSTLVLVLAAVGLLGLRNPQHRRALVLALCWGVLPPVLLGLTAVIRPTLVTRYFLIGLPGWCMLAGYGCALLGAAVSARRRVPALALALVPVVVLAWMGLSLQRLYRTPIGHGQGDPRPAIALLNSPELAGVPVVVLPTIQAINVLGYDPTLIKRMILTDDPAPKGMIIRRNVKRSEAQRRLAGVTRMVVLRHASRPSSCRGTSDASSLKSFHVTSMSVFEGWCVAVLER